MVTVRVVIKARHIPLYWVLILRGRELWVWKKFARKLKVKRSVGMQSRNDILHE